VPTNSFCVIKDYFTTNLEEKQVILLILYHFAKYKVIEVCVILYGEIFTELERQFKDEV